MNKSLNLKSWILKTILFEGKKKESMLPMKKSNFFPFSFGEEKAKLAGNAF